MWYAASLLYFTDCWLDKDGNVGYYEEQEYEFDDNETARTWAIGFMKDGAVKAVISHAF